MRDALASGESEWECMEVEGRARKTTREEASILDFID